MKHLKLFAGFAAVFGAAAAGVLAAPMPAPPARLAPLANSQVRFTVVKQPRLTAGQRQAASKLDRSKFTTKDLPLTASPLQQLIVRSIGGHASYQLIDHGGPSLLSSTGDSGFPTISAIAVGAGVYPGMIVQGAQNFITNGKLVPVDLPPASGVITVSDAQFTSANAALSLPVNPATNAAIAQAKQRLLSQPFVHDQAGSNDCYAYVVHSSHEAALKIAASASYLTANLNEKFSSADNHSTNHALLVCTQIYYTLGYSPNQNAQGSSSLDAFFAPNADINLAKRSMGPGNPPLYVNAVSYGSQLFVLADTMSDANSVANALSFSASYFGASGSVSVGNSSTDVLNSSTLHVISIGGRASAQIQFSRANGDVGQALINYAGASMDFSGSSSRAVEVGLPILYSLAYLDNYPVAEVANSYGSTASVTQQVVTLTDARVYFHGEGDGKDNNTQFQVGISDINGNPVATARVADGVAYSDHGDSPTTIMRVQPGVNQALLAPGYFDINISTHGNDTWNYTAFLTLTFSDGHKLSGYLKDSVSNDNTHHHTVLNQFFNRACDNQRGNSNARGIVGGC